MTPPAAGSSLRRGGKAAFTHTDEGSSDSVVAPALPRSPTRPPARRRLAGLVAALTTAAAALVGVGTATIAAAPPAAAEADGVGSTPAMGWSSWSYIRHDPTAANIEAQANAMVSSGLSSAGYLYANVDDFWYDCPGSQGPDVDGYGR